MIVGTTAGAMCSSPIADKLLEAQISSQQTQTEQRMENFGKPDSVNGNMQATPPSGDDGMNMGSGKGGMFAQFGGQVANYVSEINAATDLAVVMQLLGIGILLTILSAASRLYLFCVRSRSRYWQIVLKISNRKDKLLIARWLCCGCDKK